MSTFVNIAYRVLRYILSGIVLIYAALFIFKGVVDLTLGSYTDILFNFFFIAIGFVGVIFAVKNLEHPKDDVSDSLRKHAPVIKLFILLVLMSIASLVLQAKHILFTLLNFGLFIGASLGNFASLFARVRLEFPHAQTLLLLFSYLIQLYWLYLISRLLYRAYLKIKSYAAQ